MVTGACVRVKCGVWKAKKNLKKENSGKIECTP